MGLFGSSMFFFRAANSSTDRIIGGEERHGYHVLEESSEYPHHRAQLQGYWGMTTFSYIARSQTRGSGIRGVIKLPTPNTAL